MLQTVVDDLPEVENLNIYRLEVVFNRDLDDVFDQHDQLQTVHNY